MVVEQHPNNSLLENSHLDSFHSVNSSPWMIPTQKISIPDNSNLDKKRSERLFLHRIHRKIMFAPYQLFLQSYFHKENHMSQIEKYGNVKKTLRL